jgi:hypothetical protein
MATEARKDPAMDMVAAPQLPSDWQERARRAAQQYQLPMPVEETESPADVERRLRRGEQKGGQ